MTKRIVPLIVFALFVGSVAVSALRQPTAPQGFDLNGFRRLPVSVNGRVQPVDSIARIALLRIRGSATVPASSEESKEPAVVLGATEWLLEVLAKPDAADTRRIFPVDDTLAGKLAFRAGGGTGFYAFRDLAGKMAEIGRQTQRIARLKADDRAAWETELLQLQGKLVAYERLKNSVQPNSSLQRDAKGGPIAFQFADALAAYRADLSDAIRVADRRRTDGTATLDVATEQRVRAFARLFQPVSRVALLAVIPPPRPADPRGRWTTIGAAIVGGARGVKLTAPVVYFAAMSTAFAQGKAGAFNEAVAGYSRWLASNGLAPDVDQARYEVLYNGLQPLVRATAVYAVGLALLCLAWPARSTTAYRAGVLLVLLGLALHSTGLAFAFKLAGRPSFVAFACWTAAVAGVVVEWFWRRGAGAAAAAATAGAGLLTTYTLAPGGIVPLLGNVLDTNFLMAVLATVAMLPIIVIARSIGAGATIRQNGRSYDFVGRRSLRAE